MKVSGDVTTLRLFTFYAHSEEEARRLALGLLADGHMVASPELRPTPTEAVYLVKAAKLTPETAVVDVPSILTLQ